MPCFAEEEGAGKVPVARGGELECFLVVAGFADKVGIVAFWERIDVVGGFLSLYSDVWRNALFLELGDGFLRLLFRDAELVHEFLEREDVIAQELNNSCLLLVVIVVCYHSDGCSPPVLRFMCSLVVPCAL